MRMVQHIAVLITTWLFSAFAYDVHKQMTLDEIRSTFHVDHHDDVPEYEIIHIHHDNKRSLTPSSNTNKINSENSDKTSSKHDESSTLNDKKHTKIRLNAFGRPLNLTLIKNENLIKKDGLKVWTIEPNTTAQHGLEYVELPESKEEIGEVFQDAENEAAVIVRQEDNGLIVVEGSIGPDLVIRPLPKRLRQPLASTTPEAETTTTTLQTPTTVTDDYSTTLGQQEKRSRQHDDDEVFLDDDGELNAEVAIDTGFPIKRTEEEKSEEEETLGHQHIVYKKKKNGEENYSDYVFMEPDRLSKRFRRSPTFEKNSSPHSRKTREAPYTIYPEILVIVDYDGYRLHSGDNAQIKRYFISFWNGVDLRYKLLKGPKVRISIAGIIISRGRDATPYLERNRVGRDAIDSAAALTDMGKYLFRERRLPVYDIAVAITKLDMCRRQYPSDSCNRGTAGFAYVGGACVVNKRLEKVNSVAIIEDTGGFSGIIVAAHEVGHLLGAVHDGSPPPSYLGGPGAEKCQWTDGYIMSDLRHTERGFKWSPCSIASFHHFLNGDTATCLFNAPHEEEGLPRVLPGKLMTLDAQCRRDRGTSACFKDERVCAQLFCFDASSGYCVAYRPAAEGSSCGDGQSCSNGKCVLENENIIPDFSQNTPSYIRRTGPDQGRSLYNSKKNNVDPYNNNPYPELTTLYPNNYDNQNDKTPHYRSPNNNNNNNFQYYYSSTSTSTEPSNFFSIGTQADTQPPPIYNYRNNNNRNQYITENPYVYNQYTTQKPSYSRSQSNNNNPFVGNYFQLIKQTTKNPYDFANFETNYRRGKSAFGAQNEDEGGDIDNNHLKRSYNAAAYYDPAESVVKIEGETT